MKLSVSKRGFTLVELLVVIAIIGTLVGLLLPAVQAARETARRLKCVNNMKQVALGLHIYHDAKKALPASALDWQHATRDCWSWMYFVLPYIEQTTLFDACRGLSDPRHMGVSVRAQSQAPIPQFLCPADTVALLAPEAAHNTQVKFFSSKANYLANGGAQPGWNPMTDPSSPSQKIRFSQGAFRRTRGATFKEFTDGLSKTVLLGEAGGVPFGATNAAKMPGIWVGPLASGSAQFEVMRYTKEKLNSGIEGAFGSFHPGGANFALADASVRFVNDTIHSNPVPQWNTKISSDGEINTYLNEISLPVRGIYQRLSTRADGLTVADF